MSLSCPGLMFTASLSCSGCSAINPEGDIIAVSNFYDGIDLYDLNTTQVIKTITPGHGLATNVIFQLVYLDNNILLVGGTGFARTLDVHTGETLKLFEHGGTLSQFFYRSYLE